MGCRSNSFFAAFKSAAVHFTSWRAYSICLRVTLPVGLWSIFCGRLYFSKASNLQADLRDSGRLNSAQSKVRRSRKRESPILVRLVFAFFETHSFRKLMKDFLLSIGCIRIGG